MLRRRLVLWGFAVAVATLAVGRAVGDVYIAFDGATDAEQTELNSIGGGYHRASVVGPCGIVTFCDRILAMNEANKVAAWLRASSLFQVGRVAESRDSLIALRRRHPEYVSPLESQYWLAVAVGNKKEALARVRERLAMFDRQAAAGAQAWQLSGRDWYREQAFRLEGRGDEVERRIIARTESDDPIIAHCALEELGRFYLGTARYADAVPPLVRAVAACRETGKNSPAIVAVPLIDLSHAQWASVQRDTALASALEAISWASGKHGSPHLLAEALLIAHSLSSHGVGTPANRKLVAELLAESMAKFPAENEYSVMNVARCVAGKGSFGDSAARVSKVLKAAPYLDWALWAALYLSLASPECDQILADRLPDGTLQRRLYEVGRK